MKGKDLEIIARAFRESGALSDYDIISEPMILRKEDCVEIEDDWRIYQYGQTLAVLVVKLSDGDYYTVKLQPKKHR